MQYRFLVNVIDPNIRSKIFLTGIRRFPVY